MPITDGTDAEYQSAVFDIYNDLLRQSPLWSTRVTMMDTVPTL